MESSIDIESSELKNSPINNSVTNGNTTNNFYSGCSDGIDFTQLKAQVDRIETQQNRIEQTLNFLLQAIINKDYNLCRNI